MRNTPPSTDLFPEDVHGDEPSPARTAARVIAVVRSYLPAIGLATLAVTLGYAILATVLYLGAPSQKVTSLPFRLDFKGATIGQYPNGLKFSAADIVSSPNLLRVYKETDLAKFMSFAAFSRSVFVLEHNPTYQRLASEYQSRLADPRLSAVDRERIASEFESKRASLAKNEYAIHFVRSADTAKVPEAVVRRTLSEILKTWASRAVNERRVLLYRTSVLSPQIVTPTPLEQADLVAAVHVLRAHIGRVLTAIDELSAIPGAELVRTGRDRLSLHDIRLRLEDLNRFRLEPLMPLLRTTGVTNPTRTRHFLEAQLAFDRRNLETLRGRVDAIRATLAAYAMDPKALESTRTTAQPAGAAPPADSQNIVPQFSDTFIDRIVTLANQTEDVAYRQRIANDLRDAAEAVPPAEQAVAYDEDMLRQLGTVSASTEAEAGVVRADVEGARAEVRSLIEQINDLHRAISENVNPPTELYSLAGGATTNVERGTNLSRLLMFGLLAVLTTLLLSIVAALVHNALREQQQAASAERTLEEAAV